MICFKCDGGKESSFMNEEYPCAHCDEPNLVEYNTCPDCGWMWRSVNGNPIEDSLMHISDFAGMMGLPPNFDPGPVDELELTDDERALLETLEGEIRRVESIKTGEANMGDYIHRCLQCDSLAHEADKGRFKCTACDFEWEVIKFE